jgi:hypothetical protein
MLSFSDTALEDLTETERQEIIEDDLREEADALEDGASPVGAGSSDKRLLKNLALAAEESLDSSTFKSYKQYVNHCFFSFKTFQSPSLCLNVLTSTQDLVQAYGLLCSEKLHPIQGFL